MIKLLEQDFNIQSPEELHWLLREHYEARQAAVLEKLSQVLASATLTNGQQVETLETTIARRCKSAHCIAVSSATAGLTLALKVVLEDRRGKVAAPAFSFNATVLAPIWNNRRVLCLPVSPKHFNLCADALEAALKKEPVAAVIAIGVAGNLSGLKTVGEAARRAGVPFILDAAPCLGAEIEGTTLGEIADAAVISLSSRKVLPAGEGGLVLTDSPELADRLRQLRVYGSTNGFYCVEQGINARLSEIHAAVALGYAEALDEVLQRRREWAENLCDALKKIDFIELQQVEAGVTPAWNDVVLKVPAQFRDVIVAELQKIGVQAVPFYHPLIYRHQAFAESCEAQLQGQEEIMDELSESVIAVPVISTFGARHREAIANVFYRYLSA